ncbi:MAG: YbjQ family protein [Acidithiobacillus sp.]|nr:YbjQ family protein [Acidithiobacillus sp.]
MILVTTPTIEGKSLSVIGAVYGVAVRSRSDLGNFLGKIRAITGGKKAGYEKLVMAARQGAIESMITQAKEVGADAIVGFRFSSTSMGAGEQEEFIEVTAYGTAAKIRTDSQGRYL